MQLYLSHGDTRFRSHAEHLFEDSVELFNGYNKYRTKTVAASSPSPTLSPPTNFRTLNIWKVKTDTWQRRWGTFEKAERIWMSGTTLRWYPMFDETDYMMYMERRGAITQCLQISDRCLQAMQLKSHPSVCPFPERAKKWLEGAPLTKETAEHLWLSHMGDLYCEHSDFNFRMGRIKTAREELSQGLNYYHVAVRTAKERLPPSWIAPLLTKGKTAANVASWKTHER